jgi:hypothetical protein
MLSSMSHAGFLSATPHLIKPVGVPDDSLPPVPDTSQSDFALTWALQSCVWSGWAIDKMLAADLFTSAMALTAQRLGLPRLLGERTIGGGQLTLDVTPSRAQPRACHLAQISLTSQDGRAS